MDKDSMVIRNQLENIFNILEKLRLKGPTNCGQTVAK